MFKIKLTLAERITLQQILPTQGSYIDNIVAEALGKKLQLTQPELDQYGITALPGGMIGWNEAGTKASFSLELTEREQAMVKTSLEVADASKKLPAMLNSLFAVVCKPELPEDLKLKNKGGK